MMLKDYKQIEGTIGILKGVLEQLVNCFLELLGGKKFFFEYICGFILDRYLVELKM